MKYIITHHDPHTGTMDHPVDNASDMWHAIKAFSAHISGGEILAIRKDETPVEESMSDLEAVKHYLTALREFWDCGTAVYPFSELAGSGIRLQERLIARTFAQSIKAAVRPVHEIKVTYEGGVIQDIDNIPAGVAVVVFNWDQGSMDLPADHWRIVCDPDKPSDKAMLAVYASSEDYAKVEAERTARRAGA